MKLLTIISAAREYRLVLNLILSYAAFFLSCIGSGKSLPWIGTHQVIWAVQVSLYTHKKTFDQAQVLKAQQQNRRVRSVKNVRWNIEFFSHIKSIRTKYINHQGHQPS